MKEHYLICTENSSDTNDVASHLKFLKYSIWIDYGSTSPLGSSRAGYIKVYNTALPRLKKAINAIKLSAGVEYYKSTK